MRNRLMAGLLVAAVFPAALDAQQRQQAKPAIVVVSSQQCAFDKLPEVNAFWKEKAGPILDDLVKQGKLMGWGVLEHAWGDEWNNVIYYTASDQATFMSAFNEFFSKLNQQEPNLMQRFSGWCSAHKDNMYSVVASNTVQPPR